MVGWSVRNLGYLFAGIVSTAGNSNFFHKVLQLYLCRMEGWFAAEMLIQFHLNAGIRQASF